MISLKFSKKSWHYQFADMVGYHPEPDNNGNYVGDICEYTKAVLKFFLAFGIACVAFYLFAFLCIQTIFGVAFSLWFGVFLVSETGVVGLLFCFVAALAFLLYMGIEKLISWSQRNRYREPKPDGFVKHAYKSWKEKYCAKITFTD